MPRRSTISKLRTTLLTDLVLVSSAVRGIFLIQALPKPPIPMGDVQLSDLHLEFLPEHNTRTVAPP